MKPRILVPFDFGKESERALAWAIELQESTGGQIHVLHVVNPLPTGAEIGPAPVLTSREQIEVLDGELREQLERRKVVATTEVAFSAVCGEAILETARAARCDLIVMGTHGRSGLRRLALGSVAEHVLRHADCPVVTMRADLDAK